MRSALSSNPTFTAVMCANDDTAVGVMGVLRHQNISVPGVVSVIGYDDILLASNPLIDLTTIRQPRFEMGSVAAQLAIDIIAGRLEESVRTSKRLDLELVRRGSTGPVLHRR